MLNITRHGPEDNPYSTNGCEEGARNGAEGVEVAAIDDPAEQIERENSDGYLYAR